jgi:hypothetical protein
MHARRTAGGYRWALGRITGADKRGPRAREKYRGCIYGGLAGNAPRDPSSPYCDPTPPV